MSTFITTIKLLAATENDFKLLSEKLENESFSPKDSPYKKSSKEQPTQVFSYSKKKSLLDVTALVSRVAASTGKKYSFTVVKDKINIE